MPLVKYCACLQVRICHDAACFLLGDLTASVPPLGGRGNQGKVWPVAYLLLGLGDVGNNYYVMD